jgi:murein DD-endopeptidase MepM/ murein hydrolase activator NlpD
MTSIAVVAAAAVAAGATAGPASSQGGASGVTMRDGGGGATLIPRPRISKLRCVSRCAHRRRARAGSAVRIYGRQFEGVTKVVFLGELGTADDKVARAKRRRSRSVDVRVPYGANAGPVTVETAGGIRARARSLSILPPPPPSPNPQLTPVPGPRQAGAPYVETGTSRTRVYYDMRRAVVFSYRVSRVNAAAVDVQLVRVADGVPVATWRQGPATAGQVHSVVWNGGTAAAPAATGRYAFRLWARSPGGAIARSAQQVASDRDAFDLYPEIFPVRGTHDYGGEGAGFGAGRAGHSHQGQDVFAACGTRMVAARGGRVKANAFQSAAGYYLVIDGAGTDRDYFYAHLRERSAFLPGDRVYTGQRIGAVGETGNARGCHLHFELWSGPGWYSGGSPFDPLPTLRAWDAYS